MYKVFYNEKLIVLSEKPSSIGRSLKYNTESQFEEALALLRNTVLSQITLYHHNLQKLWMAFKAHFFYLEAAGGLVKNQKNQFLFIYRLEKWDLPKGKVEKGEKTEETALREVEEECGISELQLEQFLTNTYHIYFDKRNCLKNTYWYEMNYDGNEILIPQTEEGIGKVMWKNPDEIAKIQNQTYENIKIVLEKSGILQPNFP